MGLNKLAHNLGPWLTLVLGIMLALQSTTLAQTFSYTASAQDWGGYCLNGTTQSPVNIIAPQDDPFITAINLNYTTGAMLTSQRTVAGTEQAEIRGGGNITVNGTVYNPIQMHWHIPSEHTLNGTQYAAELHIVHRDAAGRYAVFGALYRRGNRTEQLLELFLQNQPPFSPVGVNTTGPTYGPVDLRAAAGQVLPNGTVGHFWTYAGSLTTPPCTEGVTWFLSTRIAQITDTEILALEYDNGGNQTIALNSRPTQALAPSRAVNRV